MDALARDLSEVEQGSRYRFVAAQDAGELFYTLKNRINAATR